MVHSNKHMQVMALEHLINCFESTLLQNTSIVLYLICRQIVAHWTDLLKVTCQTEEKNSVLSLKPLFC